MTATHLVQQFETFLSELWWEFKCVQGLIYHVDESLGIVPMERLNHIPFIPT